MAKLPEHANNEREVGHVDDVADVWVTRPGHPARDVILVRVPGLLDATQARVLAALLIKAARVQDVAKLRRCRRALIARRT